MHFFAPCILACAAASSAYGLPNSGHIEERDVQTVTLIFQGAAATYNMTIPADGHGYPTNNDISVDFIISPDYDPYNHCTLTTPGIAARAPSIIQRPQDVFPINQITLGPPQPVIAVGCVGSCLGVYGTCFDTDDQSVSPCCNGFCAADRCRPWNAGQN